MIAILAAAQWVFFAVTIGLVYWFWIRPILKSRPEFSFFYNHTEKFWHSIRMRFSDIKGKLLGALAMAASAIVGTHDFLIPYISRVEWTPLTSHVPDWAWPLISFAILFLLDMFRRFAEQRRATG